MSYYIYRDFVPLPTEENRNPYWVLPDTCPECHNLNCNQLLDGDRVSRYMCTNPECNHEWIPTKVMEIKQVVYCVEPEVEIDPEVIKRLQEDVERGFVKYLFGQG